jgi:predicted ATPase/signal transduction histidine kinase
MQSSTYTIVDVLHESERAMVYRVVRNEDSRTVTLKVLGPRRPSARDVARLRNELMVDEKLASLACVVHPIGLDSYEGMPALVLEGFQAEPLDRLIGAPLPTERFLRLAIGIAGALAEIHAAGVVHKDIKPENILVGAQDAVKLTDFGLASLLPCDQATARSPQFIEGSLPYMSPEQTGRTNRSVDHRTDLYSLGVALYRMLAGRLPFTAADPPAWIHCHLARSPPPLRGFVADVPEALEGIVMKLLAKVPEARYQSARGVKHDLELCLAQWLAEGRIESIPLGAKDVSERFRIPQKVYGREREVATLTAAVDRVFAAARTELFTVSGYAGCGKTALVHEMREPVIRRGGFFIRGKFDQYKRNIPYATIVEAFKELVGELLAGSEEQVRRWRQDILDSVGVNGRLIVEVIPLIALIIGEQPPVSELALSEAQARFDMVFRRFMMVFARQEHPLVLFLDDLQWADPASIKLLRNLVVHPDPGHLLVIAAYRDNEVSAAHPVSRTLEHIREAGAPLSELVLEPLASRPIASLIADTLRCRSEDAAPLAELVREKTDGNPFFMIQFLTALYQEHLIEFDPDGPAWRWDIERIRQQGLTDNVVELLVERLRRLPAAAQDVLKLAACVGSTASARTLAVISERSEPEVHCDLWESLRAGLTLRFDDTYGFTHDRVQQAAYSMISDDERAGVHLRIGRLLLAQTPAEEVERGIFEIVHQLDLGAPLISSRAEKKTVAGLNLVAGRKAKSSAAYDTAIGYLAAGMALLDEDSWQSEYELTFGLHFERAQCACMTGKLAEADELLDSVLRRARTTVDRAAIYRVKIDLHVTRSENRKAVAAALEGLRLFKIEMSPHPTREDVLLAYADVQRQLAGRRIEDLIDLPAMTDPDMQAAMHVLSALFAPAYFTDSNRLQNHLCHMVNLSLRCGNTDASAHGYAWFGVILGPVFHEYRDGYRFGRLAHDFVERNDIAAYRARVLYSLELIVLWTEPIDRAIALIQRAFDVGVKTGDMTVTCYACNHIVTDRLIRGVRLEEVHRDSEQRLEFVRKVGFHDVAAIIVSIQRFVQCMRGLTASLACFSDASFDEREFEAGLTEDRMSTMVCWYFILKLAARFLAGDYESALAAGARAKQLLWASLSHPQIHEFHYYHALALAALYDRADPERQKEWLAAMTEHEAQLAEWAENCPSTFRDKQALVAAEIARVTGREFEAMRLYEDARGAAEAGGFVQNVAICHEVAARFYLQREFVAFARCCLQAARSAYATWGAEGKVKDLDRRYPSLAERRPLLPAGTFAVAAEELDLLSVVKASQAISGEIELESLVRRLIQVAVEQGGADRGSLTFLRDGELRVVAHAAVGETGVEVTLLESIPVTSAVVPTAIINYCHRTGDTVILEDAAEQGRFSSDDYLARMRPRSVLCLPIRRHAEVKGLLYLENNVMTGAFTPARLAVLELLASQAAISLENAQLFRATKRAVSLRNEFISIASHELYTPVTALMLSLHRLTRLLAPPAPDVSGPRPPERAESAARLVRVAERQGERLTKLIGNLLDASRLEAGCVALELEPVDLVALVHEVVELIKSELSSAGCAVSFHEDGPVSGQWDRSRLGQVVMNLLSNAIKYGRGRPIEITIGAHEGTARLAVRDQGIGIELARQARIFDRFERAAPVEHYGGLGLGLFICKGIVAAHLGNICVESRPGEGATFIVTLPCARAGPAAPSPGLSSPPAPTCGP